MTDPSAEDGPDDLDGPLRDLLDDQRRREAAERRRHAHWLGQEAEEAGGLAGILVDLGERGAPTSIGTGSGRRLAGAVLAVGTDVVELRTATGQRTLVALAAVATVRPEPGSRPTVGDRRVVAGGTLHDRLVALAADRPEVVVRTRAGEGVAGRLRAVGADVLTLAQAEDRATVHVALDAVAEVLLA